MKVRVMNLLVCFYGDDDFDEFGLVVDYDEGLR
jgi:hypothetical protein